jgi:hypothetical protein
VGLALLARRVLRRRDDILGIGLGLGNVKSCITL